MMRDATITMDGQKDKTITTTCHYESRKRCQYKGKGMKGHRA